MNDVTIEQLVESIQQLHTATTGYFGKLDSRMDRLDGRMDRLDGRMDRLEGRMDRVERRLTNLEMKVDEGFARIEQR